MNFIKKYFKLFVGVGVLILVLVTFFFAKRSNVLETGSLKDWRAASTESRMSAARILTGTDTMSNYWLHVLIKCHNYRILVKWLCVMPRLYVKQVLN